MKARKLHNLWIIICIVCYTAHMCTLAIGKSIWTKVDRRWVDKTLRGWTDKLLKILNIDCKVINPHDVKPEPGKATMIMCNHSSHFDIPLSFYAFPQTSIRMLAKKEMKKIPLMGRAMRATEFPFVARKNNKEAIQDLQYMQRLLQDNIVIWVAPEGTRSQNGQLQPFKKGCFITAIQTQATIIPIGVRGAFDILPARTLQFNLGQHAEIHIGEPIDASQYTLQTKDALISRVHQAIQQLVTAP